MPVCVMATQRAVPPADEDALQGVEQRVSAAWKCGVRSREALLLLRGFTSTSYSRESSQLTPGDSWRVQLGVNESL